MNARTASRLRAVQVMVEMENEGSMFDILLGMSINELQTEYELDYHDASSLWYVIHDREVDYSVYQMKEKFSKVLLETLVESVHQSFEGWSDDDQFVIRAYLADITYGVGVTLGYMK
jgi:hypothetical protein